MKRRAVWLLAVLLWGTLAGCGGRPGPSQAGQACPDLAKIVEAFYAANDAGQPATGLQYLTDDVALVGWAEGANGHHMAMYSAVGRDQVKDLAGQPGLKRTASQPDLPNFTMQEVKVSGIRVSFKLIPDRLHPNGRPYNPYYVEAFFSGCQIELLKVVERITWL